MNKNKNYNKINKDLSQPVQIGQFEQSKSVQSEQIGKLHQLIPQKMNKPTQSKFGSNNGTNTYDTLL